jgi:hypothetical protein
MGESLSYIGSRSLGFVYGSTKKEAYPDENYSRSGSDLTPYSNPSHMFCLHVRFVTES